MFENPQPPRRHRARAAGIAAVAALALAAAPAVAQAAAPADQASQAHPAPQAKPAASSDCPWLTSGGSDTARAKQVVAKMTLDEKISMVHGADAGDYTGLVAGIPRLCVPRLKLQDGPVGVRMDDTTQLPSATALAATWDTDAAHDYGAVIGAEDKAKGVDVDLGPTVNIVRDPRWGRAFETYSEDPHLTGQIGAQDIEGIQSTGVMAQLKHWAIYNQETNRNSANDDAIVDDRTVREIYASAFESIVDEAEPASVMCSYSYVNGTDACENPYLNDILKKDFGFDGFITSDWWGTKSTVAAANAGMDLEMPNSTYFGDALKTAVTDGKVPESRVDDMVTRILREEFRFDLFAHPSADTPDAVASTDAHVASARSIAEDGTVLLKNEGDVLPLTTSTRSVAVIGSGASTGAVTGGGGSAAVAGTGTVTPLEGITDRAAQSGVDVTYAPGGAGSDGSLPPIEAKYLTPSSGTGNGLTAQLYASTDLTGDPVVTRTDPQVAFTWNGAAPAEGVSGGEFSARWTGTLTPPATGAYTVGLTSDDGSRLIVDGKTVIDNWGSHGSQTKTAALDLTAGTPVSVEVDYYQGGGGSNVNLGWTAPGHDPLGDAVAAAQDADVAVVYANNTESEGGDLQDIDLPGSQDELIAAVAKANPRTVVVLNTGSAVTMPWVDDVAGLFEAWYPGQESGTAIASLLFGDTNPSGKLPVTFPRSLADVPASTESQWPGVDGKVQFSEGLDVGYRWYDAHDVEPLFPFGYGLSYTSFRVSGLHLSSAHLAEDGSVKATATVTNTGKVAGSDVVQVYLSQPRSSGEPPKSLVGFEKVSLKPGKSTKVSVTIDARDASAWNSKAHTWALTPGTYTVRAGDSSSHLPTKDYFSVTRTTQPRWVTVKAPGVVTPGKAATVRTTFTNASTTTAKDVRTSLQLPEGWTTSPRSSTTLKVAPGTSVTTSWKVAVPKDAAAGPATVGATSRYDGGSAESSTDVAVPYADLAAAYDTVGVSDDSDETAGNLDGSGYSYSAQALASVGVSPGAAVPGGYGGLVFPKVAAGRPDAVSTAGQVVTMSGTGTRLALLGTGTSSEQTGTLTVTYTDGTTSSATVRLADWYNNNPTPGSVIVATTPYWNRPAGSTNQKDQKVSLYATSVPLTAGKQVRTITLPDNPRLHVFATAIG
ncbi:glycoside hydrolase family 3 C-terminal domain-containing protein [Cellulomonas sp. PhB143]|uniref:glycoside hydrolase family 3 C-terminal domain-containing protein n=1 Tax=Cellulomonas sp. PhB143 TaxID=2485186 RepID=UPI000F4A3F46|nr:glycoside hydrolase family 3 C-terminal domain-containing protein [Cellulomonas sp. PhB143]ROS78661.1 beta-glucosidase [Cellulomonas sp. PhB143]